jgi:hypothetical protein
MKKFRLFLCLFTAFLITGINSCKKDAKIPNSTSQDVINPQEIVAWLAALPQASELQPQWDNASQTVLNSHNVVQLPIGKDASLFFTKTNGKLNAFAYKWLNKDPGSHLFTGNVVVFSFKDNSIKCLVYNEGTLVKSNIQNLYNLPLSSPGPVNGGSEPSNGQTNQQHFQPLDGSGGDWLGAILCWITGGSWTGYQTNHCDYTNSIWAAIRSFYNNSFDSGGSTNGGTPATATTTTSSDGSVESAIISSGGSISVSSATVATDGSGAMVYVTVNPPPCDPGTGGQTLNPDGSGVENPCGPGGGVSFSQWVKVVIPIDEPESVTGGLSINDGDADEDNNPDGNFDITTYPDYDPQSTPWPTISDVLSGKGFIPYYAGSNCLDLAKQQIAPNTISNYGAPGQTIQIYTEAAGSNVANAKTAISYINSELSNGRPVIVGVDVLPGQSKPPYTDNSTDHFIEIVASGTDNNGNYYQFRDNSTKNATFGTSSNNKLYFNPTTGKISGNTTTAYDNPEAQAAAHNAGINTHPYILTQVRKNKKP